MTNSKPTILLIDDDAEIRYSLDRVLAQEGYSIMTADSGSRGSKRLSKKPNLIFLDNRMEGISGIETLQHLRTAAPSSMVILMTAFGTSQTAIEAMKHGAFDYVLKPFDLKKLKELVSKALKAGKDSVSSEESYERLLNSADYAEGIVGSGERMQQVLKKVGQVAASEATVMITGESGTGKELVARCIHRHSHRSEGPFHAVNCAAIPENLIESELFGHEKGSFTGATDAKTGQFELCHGGTLFLDEIGDMLLPTQTKILRAIQEGEIQRVGATRIKKIDVRVIAATHKNLEEMVRKKSFREDLYYRLNVVRIETPPLRERMEDLPELVDLHAPKAQQETVHWNNGNLQGSHERHGEVQLAGKRERIGKRSSFLFGRIKGKAHPLQGLAQHFDESHRFKRIIRGPRTSAFRTQGRTYCSGSRTGPSKATGNAHLRFRHSTRQRKRFRSPPLRVPFPPKKAMTSPMPMPGKLPKQTCLRSWKKK